MSSKQKNIDLNKKNIVLMDMRKSTRIPFLIQEARKRGWRFFEIDPSDKYIPDGFKIIGAITDSMPDDPFCCKLRKLGYPVVRLGNLPNPKDHLQPVVVPDLFKAGTLAAEHFASRGFKNVGFIGHNPWGDAKGIYDGFLEHSRRVGMELHLLTTTNNLQTPPDLKGQERQKFIRDFRNNEFINWLKEVPKPFGFLGRSIAICANIDMLCNSLGIAVPGEVSILCHDDVPQCCMSYTPLSAIDIGLENLAGKTVDLLSDLIDGNPPDESCVFVSPSGIVLRQSTDILAVADPAVAKALGFMWENLSNPISVIDIAEFAGIPLRSLKRSFKKCLNRSMTQELLRKRLEKAASLLRNENMAVSDILTDVGFSSASYFHKRFKEAYGMTPNAFKAMKHENS